MMGKQTVMPAIIQYPAICTSSLRKEISLTIWFIDDRLMLPAY
jgi:hypothetical protein